MTYSPQSASSALNPGRTLGRQLELAILRREEQPADMAATICEILMRLTSNRAAFSLVGELSGGIKPKAALAVAVALTKYSDRR